jgi:hypothetical protein
MIELLLSNALQYSNKRRRSSYRSFWNLKELAPKYKPTSGRFLWLYLSSRIATRESRFKIARAAIIAVACPGQQNEQMAENMLKISNWSIAHRNDHLELQAGSLRLEQK